MAKAALPAILAFLLLHDAAVAAAPTVVQSSPFLGQAVQPSESQIDRMVLGNLRQLRIQPAQPCSDAVFLRRVFLDVIGTLPTPQEAQAFLANEDPNKRRDLIDHLLDRDEFADYQAMRWSGLLRVKAEFPINLWPNAAQAYHHWIRSSIRENKPYDRFVREMLVSNGSNFRVPEVNFYRAVQSKDPKALAQTVALTFMGTRADKWPAERLSGMAGFFSQIGYKSTLEWKEEIVFFDPTKVIDGSLPKAVFPDGTEAHLTADTDPRTVFADWLIKPSNPWFAKNIVNRVWSWLLGRGIIQEPDDIRPDNPPSNPELLTYLERQLVADRYDIKQIYRLILNSQTYQLSSISGSADPRAPASFAFYPARRMEAEVLIDAICQITGTTEQYSSAIPEPFTFVPKEQRAITLPDGSITSSFLDMFGRPSRDTGMESERNNRLTADQELHLLNSTHIQLKLQQNPRLQTIMQTPGTQKDRVNAIYLLVLSRYPTNEELKVIQDYAQAAPIKGRPVMVDLEWALINSQEFLYRH